MLLFGKIAFNNFFICEAAFAASPPPVLQNGAYPFFHISTKTQPLQAFFVKCEKTIVFYFRVCYNIDINFERKKS